MSRYSERQAAKLSSTDESGAAGDNVKAFIQKDALQAKMPPPAYQEKSTSPFFRKEADEFRARCRISTGNGTIQPKPSDKLEYEST
jgi:hypothetical protein